jgi:hypothetical protein
MSYFPGNLGLEGYVEVNADDIANNLSLFETDGEGVGAAFDMLCNSLLAGNILFQSKNGPDKSSRFESDEAAADWRSKIFHEVTKKAFLYLKAVRFVVYDAIDDEENQNAYGRKPVIFDPRDLIIYFKRDVYQRISTRIFERMRSPTNAWLSLLGGGGAQPMKELTTAVIHWAAPPMPDGTLSNSMKQVWKNMSFEDFLWSRSVVATDQRANPVVATQQVEQKVDDNKLFLGNPADSSGGPMSLHLGDGKRPGMMTGGQYNSLLQAAQKVGVAPNQQQPQQQTSGSSKMEVDDVGGYSLKHYKLPSHRQYVKTNLPESPIDAYFAFRIARKEAIFQIFGIPLAMVSQQSSLGQKTSMNENARTAYEDTQKSIKQMLIPIIKDIYRHTLADSHALDHLTKWAQDGGETERDEKSIARHLETKMFKDSIDVDIAFPGLPPAEKVEQLFLSKTITWDYYKSYTHAMFGIPFDAFSTTEPPNPILEELKKKEQSSTKK